MAYFADIKIMFWKNIKELKHTQYIIFNEKQGLEIHIT